MDLFYFVRALFRRWWIALPILIATGLFAWSMLDSRAVQYTTSGSQLVFASPSARTGQVGASPAAVAAAVADLLSDASTRRTLADDGLVDTYEVGLSASATIVQITIHADSVDSAIATGRRLGALAPQVANEVLGSAAAGVSVRLLSEPEESDVVRVDASYTLEVSLLVLPSAAQQGNPFPATLSTVRSLLETTSAVEFASTVASSAPTARFSATSEPRDSAPIITVVVVADNPQDAINGYQSVVEGLSQQLEVLQDEAGIDTDDQTTLRTLAAPASAYKTTASVVRPIAGVLVLGLGAALALAAGIDTLITRRRERGRPGMARQEAIAIDLDPPGQLRRHHE